MKESTEVTEANNWPWLLDAVNSICNEASSEETKFISLALFKRLPVVALQQISSLLPLRRNRQKQSTLANRALMFSVGLDETVNQKGERIIDPILHKVLYQDYVMDQFLYLIATEGEDNQNQAEAILKQLLKQENYALMDKLISIQKLMRDAAGRCFKSMSAVGYAFWAGDTRMSRMLEKYINALEENGYETKQKVFYECQHIEEQGIEFTFDGKRIEHSKHFDWQPIIAAQNAYIDAARALINANDGRGDWRAEAWALVDILWLKIGKELAKITTAGAQECCSDIPFSPLSNFQATLNSPNLKRTVKFYNWMSDRMESWFLRGVAHPNLGILFSIYKGLDNPAMGMGDGLCNRWWWFAIMRLQCCNSNLAAFTALCEMRTVDDRKQTLENLKPLAASSDFHP